MNSTNSEVHAGDYTADTYLLLFQANEKKRGWKESPTRVNNSNR